MKFYIYDVDDNFEDSDSYSKWDYLLQNTLILFAEPRILKKIVPISKKWLTKYEQTNNFRLPDDYKNFLSTYGGGGFGNNAIGITTPLNEKEREEERDRVVQALQRDSDVFTQNPQFNVVKNGYIFGCSEGGTYFLFDLNSFRVEDACCDIYVFSILCPHIFISCLGRDFFYFVRELCLNNKIDEWLPDNISLSTEIEENEEEEPVDLSELNCVFIPSWELPRSWQE
jgi:hypothetical protein